MPAALVMMLPMPPIYRSRRAVAARSVSLTEADERLDRCSDRRNDADRIVESFGAIEHICSGLGFWCDTFSV
jgi:hypothetical protein